MQTNQAEPELDQARARLGSNFVFKVQAQLVIIFESSSSARARKLGSNSPFLF
ncbi:hypothetical protein HanIR_Chr01g0014321 [Helianthus annuus]|nr:hypothetical protein HanIR_Chr01g0014321 [Helianthus annuus]